MDYDPDGYLKTEYMAADNIKKDIWAGGRARDTESRR